MVAPKRSPADELTTRVARRWLQVIGDPSDAMRSLANFCAAIWAVGDWQDQQGEAQFATPCAWMEDPSVWEDVYEDNLAKGVKMTTRQKLDHSRGRS